MSDVEPLAAPIVVRVVDAHLVDDGAPVHVVVSGELPVADIAHQVANGGGRSQVVDGRLVAVGLAARLVDAAGRVGGQELADPFRAALDAALEGWIGRPADLVTAAGTLPLSRRPVVMGILNVTPDSFSDGGQFVDAGAAVERGRRMLAEGADLVDVGGESTRPGAAAVPEDVERDRVVPVVRALADAGAVVSIDTTKAAVARAAVDAGAVIVNDVSAGFADDAMLRTVADLGVHYVAMHARGTPADMQDDPRYGDVVAEVFEHLADAVRRCEAAGIDRARVVVDPGIGFGKTVDHNLALVAALRDLQSLGRPVLLGASRKSFLGAVTGVQEPQRRVASSVAVAVLGVDAGASIVRVHDVQATVEALKVASSVRGGHPVDWT